MNPLYWIVLVGSIITAVASLMSINRELGAMSATTATLVEQGRDHGNQLQALKEAVNRIAPK